MEARATVRVSVGASAYKQYHYTILDDEGSQVPTGSSFGAPSEKNWENSFFKALQDGVTIPAACGDGRFTLVGRSPKPYILARAAKGLPRRVLMEFLIPSAHFGAVGDHWRFEPPNNHPTAQGDPVPQSG